MQIKLYKTNTSANSLTKNLTHERSFNITLKDKNNIITPEIALRTTTMLDFNYAYIPHFNRYYFVNSVESTLNGVNILYLYIDVLMSYKNDILAAKGDIHKPQPDNLYVDSGYQYEIRKTSRIVESDVQLNPAEKSKILVTIGGIVDG